MPVNTYSFNELTRFIEAVGESANFHAKGPMAWDSGEASAGLTKDSMALPNRRDGGVIVIGNDEPGPAKFLLTGFSESGFDFQCEAWSEFPLVSNRAGSP